jgi:hypothetical protein
MAKPKRPRDTNQLAKLIVDLSIGETAEKDPYEGKNKAAVDLGRRGGMARAAKLTPQRLAEIAHKGVAARAAKRRPAESSASPSSGSQSGRQKKKRRAVIQVPED